MSLKRVLVSSIVIFLISYGQLYHSYKNKNPNFGNNDYFKYREMVTNPLDFTVTEAPFIYRQFTTLVSRVILDAGIFYPTEINYKCEVAEQKVFFAILSSNYIGLFLCFLTMIYYLNMEIKRLDIKELLFPIFLVMTSFGYTVNGLSVQTEGWTYFFNTLLFILFLKRQYYLFCLFAFLSILNKELSSIYMSIFLFSLITHRYLQSKKLDITTLKYLSVTLFSFFVYFAIRKFIIPVAGAYEHQLELSRMVDNLWSFRLGMSYILQGVLSLGALLIFFFFLIINKKLDHIYKNEKIFSLLLVVFGLYLIGILTGIGENVGRILSSLTPVMVLIALPYLSFKNEENLFARL